MAYDGEIRVMFLVQYCDIMLPLPLCFTISKPAGSFSRPLHKQARLSWSTRTAIYHASESGREFRHWSDLKFVGVLVIRGNALSVTVSNHTEEAGKLEAEIKLNCVLVWFWSNNRGWCVCVCERVQSVSHIWQLTNTKRHGWTSGQGLNWTSSGMTVDDRYHHSQLNCLDYPVMNSRFTVLISDCKVIACRQQNNIFSNVFTKVWRKDLIGQVASQRAGSQTVTLSLNSNMITFKPDFRFSLHPSAPLDVAGPNVATRRQ